MSLLLSNLLDPRASDKDLHEYQIEFSRTSFAALDVKSTILGKEFASTELLEDGTVEIRR